MKRKLNIVDYVIIAVILIVLAFGAMFLLRSKGKKSEGAKIITGRQSVEILAEAHTVLPNVASEMKVGDKLVAQKTFQNGEVLEVEVSEDYEIGAKNGEIVKLPLAQFKCVRVKIRADANRYGPYLDLGGQMLKVGENYWIKTDKANLFGSIIGLKLLEDN